MKQITILSLIILANLTYGQLQLKSLLSNPDYYVYNNSKDTLYLTKLDVSSSFGCRKSTKVFDTVQIDGIGSKEIVFERIYSGTKEIIMQASQSKKETKIHKYEIWNVDTKTLQFEAIVDYEFSYYSWNSILPDSLNNRSKGICSYKYDFTIDNKGLISISNLNYKNVANNCTADKKEGSYKFINGKYSYETSNSDTMKIIGVNDSAGIQLVKRYNAKTAETNFAKYYLYWNSKQDSILIPIPYCYDSGYPHYDTPFLPIKGMDTCNIFAKQLDKQGLFEVIIKHYKNNATFTTIISLDSRKILFNAANSNRVHYSLSTDFGNESHNNSYCSYSYEIAFDEDNNLIIHKLEQQGGKYPRGPIDRKKGSGINDYFSTCCQPDKKEGVYVLENGIYTYSESKSKEQKNNNKLNTYEK